MRVTRPLHESAERDGFTTDIHRSPTISICRIKCKVGNLLNQYKCGCRSVYQSIIVYFAIY